MHQSYIDEAVEYREEHNYALDKDVKYAMLHQMKISVNPNYINSRVCIITMSMGVTEEELKHMSLEECLTYIYLFGDR